ncbi:ParM/StbA family protein [Diaphorobacter sp. DS2]|nr:ParM/StbA family protein [Diaphorobacter sp. DS2]
MSQGFVLGMDIGYSNLNLAMGYRDKAMETKILPVGAAPIEFMPRTVTGGYGTAGDFVQVLVNGEQWVAGVEPERLQGWERELHASYPETNQYKALFYAALALTGQKEIEVLVTGLPVSQFVVSEHRQSLENMLKGKHRISEKVEIEVKNVLIVPQPAGAYMDMTNKAESDLELLINEGKTIVIDPGFFSVDWVALEEGEVRFDYSGTSLKAMSVLLERTALLIRNEYGGDLSVEKIEKAIRAGKNEIPLYGQMVNFRPYLEHAMREVPKEALTALKKTMRSDGLDADVVLLAGGGALAYQDAAVEIFPKSRIVVSDEPVMANARGFWLLAG